MTVLRPFDALGYPLLVGSLLLVLLDGCPQGQAAAQSGFPDLASDAAEISRLVERFHPSPFIKVDAAVWRAEGKSIEAAASQPGAQRDRIIARMMRWVAMIGDGHTNLEPKGMEEFELWYPVRFTQFSDGLYVTGAVGDGLPLNGARIDAIGGRPAADVAELQSQYQGVDNEFGRRDEGHLLSNAGLMMALGVAGEEGALELSGSVEGRSFSEALEPVRGPFEFGWRFWGEMYGPPASSDVRDWRAAFDGAPVASYRRLARSRPDHLSYRMPYEFWRLGEAGPFYFAFNFTQNYGEVPLKKKLSALFEAIDREDDPRLIIDIRYNSGGDGSLLLPLVHGLIRRPKLDQHDRLFVITGQKTFSAAVILTGYLNRHTNATFVGTPPSAPLNHFGDPRLLVLPETGMHLWVSTLYHQFGPFGGTPEVFPIDVPAPMSAKAYFQGRDPALEAVLGDADVRPIREAAIADSLSTVEGLIDKRVSVAAASGWERWRPFEEQELKYEGYEALLQGDTATAIALLELVTRWYPESSDAFDRLAQAYEAASRLGDATSAFERALQIDPLAAGARAALDRLNAASEGG